VVSYFYFSVVEFERLHGYKADVQGISFSQGVDLGFYEYAPLPLVIADRIGVRMLARSVVTVVDIAINAPSAVSRNGLCHGIGIIPPRGFSGTRKA
jgi:hypothetical protein